MTPRAWPERPAAPRNEQRALPLPGTLEGRYAAWRKTPDGERVFRACEGLVLYTLATERPKRIASKWVWEEVRKRHKITADNSFTPLMARELEDLFPCLRGLFRYKERKAL